MATRTPTLNAFTLSAGEGRTPKPLNIHGAQILVKLADADTHGAIAIFHEIAPPLSGPPLHRHSHEDEWFYVLNGEITLQIDGERTVLSAGSSGFAPRGTVHTFQNFGNSPAEMLVIATPGRLNLFLKELAALNAGGSTPDMDGIERVAADYGMEILGPPLS
jgi:quercetin dioxygenase-like cupin family protein